MHMYFFSVLLIIYAIEENYCTVQYYSTISTKQIVASQIPFVLHFFKETAA